MNLSLIKSLTTHSERYTHGSPLYKVFTIILEALITHLAVRLAFELAYRPWGLHADAIDSVVVFTLAWIGCAALVDMYIVKNILQFRGFPKRFIFAFFGHLIFFLAYQFLIDKHHLPFAFYAVAFGGSGTLIIGFRIAVVLAYKYRRFLLARDMSVLVVGQDTFSRELLEHFSYLKINFQHLKNSDKAEPNKGWDHPANFQLLKAFCRVAEIDELYFTDPIENQDTLVDLQNFADENYMYLRISTPEIVKVNQGRGLQLVYVEGKTPIALQQDGKIPGIAFFGNVPIMRLREQPMKPLLSRLSKRAVDLLGSFFGLLLISPFFLLLALLIKLDSRGPVFFLQARSGRRNNEFTVFKFRTMYVRPPEKGYQQATKNDPRVTKVGAFLRRTSLDELPQLINVLMGQMSLVGPRPHPLPLNDMYAPKIDRYQYRYFPLPGITGWAQVNGYRGETAEPGLMQKRVEFDHWYIENWSLILDFKIMFLTIWNVVQGEKNAY